MSELSVGSLSGLAANSYVIDVASGSSLDLSNATDLPASALPAGSILQVVSTTKTDTYSATVGLAESHAVPGLSATITPSSASSKIMVFTNISIGVQSTGTTGIGYVLYRDGSPMESGIGDTAGSRTRASAMQAYLANITTSLSASALDSPATTSAVTYDARIRHYLGGTLVMQVNKNNQLDSDSDTYMRLISTITLMEVAG